MSTWGSAGKLRELARRCPSASVIEIVATCGSSAWRCASCRCRSASAAGSLHVEVAQPIVELVDHQLLGLEHLHRLLVQDAHVALDALCGTGRRPRRRGGSDRRRARTGTIGSSTETTSSATVERGTRSARGGVTRRRRRRGRSRTSTICGSIAMIVADQGDANMAVTGGRKRRPPAPPFWGPLRR